MREIKASSGGGRSSPTSEKTADAVCVLRPQEGVVSLSFSCVLYY